MGNKPTEKEIITSIDRYTTKHSLNTANLSTQYTVIKGQHSVTIKSPVRGFLNILYPKTKTVSINPYVFNQQSYILRSGENIIHSVDINDNVTWRNVNKHNVALILYIPYTTLQGFTSQSVELHMCFKNGLLTKSDRHLELICKEILGLYDTDTYTVQLKIQSLITSALVHQIERLNLAHEK